MQAHLEDFSFSKNCNFYPFRFYYIKTWEKCSLLLPSHNCIIIHNVQFSRCIWIFLFPRDSMKLLVFKKLQSISLVEISGIEPLTSCLQGRRSPSWAKPPDLFRYKILDIRYKIFWESMLNKRCCACTSFILYLISHILYLKKLVGQNGLEPSTSRLSVVCSSQLSYWPIFGLLSLLRYIPLCTL